MLSPREDLHSPSQTDLLQLLLRSQVVRTRKIYHSSSAKKSLFFRERINKQATNLIGWLSARAALADSIAAQKCGLFHRQVILRKQNSVNMNQFSMLVKNVVPPSSATSNVTSTSSPTEAVFKFAYRDNKPKKPLQESRDDNQCCQFGPVFFTAIIQEFILVI